MTKINNFKEVDKKKCLEKYLKTQGSAKGVIFKFSIRLRVERDLLKPTDLARYHLKIQIIFIFKMLPKGNCEFFALFSHRHNSCFFNFYITNIDMPILSHFPNHEIYESKVPGTDLCCLAVLCLYKAWVSACPTTRAYWVLLKLREQNGCSPEEGWGWEPSDKTELGMHQNEASFQRRQATWLPTDLQLRQSPSSSILYLKENILPLISF